MKFKLLLMTIFSFFSLSICASNHTANSLKFLSEFIDPGCLVFDIGAHIGDKTQLYRACEAQVICLEPQPACCEHLKERFKNDPLVTIIPKGVAAKPGTLQLSICSQATTISTFSSRWREESRFANNYRWDRVIEVEVTTLDHLIEIYGCPQFCKIDVENYEYEVLLGLHSPIPYLSFEAAYEVLDYTTLCIEYLETLGYHSFNFALEEGSRLVNEKWLSGKEVIQLIQTLAVENPLVWGDIYARHQNE